MYFQNKKGYVIAHELDLVHEWIFNNSPYLYVPTELAAGNLVTFH